MPTVALKSLAKTLQRHDERSKVAVARGLRSAAAFGRKHLVSVTPKDRGMAKAAWKVHNGPLNARGVTPAAWVENSSPYIGILENGARPHAVSEEGQQAIYEWVVRNLRLVGNRQEGYAAVHGNDLHEGQRRRTFGAVDGGERLAKQITFLICRKIRKYGSKPGFFIRDSMELLTRVAQQEVERCLREEAAKVES